MVEPHWDWFNSIINSSSISSPIVKDVDEGGLLSELVF